jgi:hypothetical protein
MKTAAEMQKAANEQADATYKAFQAFSKAGATGSDGLKGFFNDVNRMRLNVHQLDAMAGVMANSAKEMSAMGGTVYKARGQFADLVQGMGDFETGMLNLGMSYDDQAEAAMGYMKLQSTLSQGQQKDYGKLSGGMKKYLQETEALARVTGLSRKEQEAVQEKMLAQQRFGAKVQELRDNGQNEAADLLVSQMKKYAAKGDMYAQAFADSSTGMLTSEAALKGNTSSMGKIMEEATGITSGRIKTEQEANESFQDTMGAVKDVTKSMNMLYQAGVGEDFLLPFKEGAEVIKGANQNFAEQIAEAGKEVEKLINSTDEVDEQLKRYNGLIKTQNDEMLATQRSLNGSFSATGVGLDGFGEILARTGEILMQLAKKAFDLLGLTDAAEEREMRLGKELAQSERAGSSGEVGMAMDAGQSTMSVAPETVKSTKEMGFFDRLLVGEENFKKRQAAEAAGQTPAQAAAATTMPESRTTTNLMQASVGLDAKPPAPAGGAPASAKPPAPAPAGGAPAGGAPAKYNEKPLQGGGAAPATNKSSIPVAEKPITKVIAGGDGETTVQVEDGSKQKRVGEASWRNNNPGNLRPAPFLQGQPGYVGQATNSVSGTFLVFKTREDGINARYQMLFNNPKSQYYTADTSIRKAITSYAPPKENDTEAYIRTVAKALGLPDSTTLGQLNAGQKQAMGDAITQHEGKKTGKVLQAAKGGVFDGPKSGYSATLHGMEAVIPLKDGAVPVSMSQEFNVTATNLGELVAIMKSNVDMQASMLAVLDDLRRSQNTTADNTGKMVAYASN